MDRPQRNTFNDYVKYCVFFIIYSIVTLIITTVMFIKSIIIIFTNVIYNKPSLLIWIIFYVYLIDACFLK